MPLKLALPKDRLQDETARLLDGAGWGLDGYRQPIRSYRLESAKFPGLLVRVFQEKDIPIQVAIGNYDLGICGLDWIEELSARYPSGALMKIRELGYGYRTLYVAATSSPGVTQATRPPVKPDNVRIVSEYPNLAESVALDWRLPRFSIFPVWGAAEVYPPENADLVLVSVQSDAELSTCELTPVTKVLTSSAFLIANRASWETKDMGSILASIHNHATKRPQPDVKVKAPPIARQPDEATDEDTIWLALPDGHQQPPAMELLTKAGIKIADYLPSGSRRPTSYLRGVKTKVIRPQDMPLQVATGNFDLAITGRDWLTEHLYQFPSSPVSELLDLKFGKVRIVAVVSDHLSANDIENLRQLSSQRQRSLRVASEYVNIADRYARDNHLGWYRVVPTWGASEGFLPEDADLLIENTQTGRTLSQHNLKIVDTLFQSTARLIGNTAKAYSKSQSERIKSITHALRTALEG